jgi:hypothetical protein
MASTRNKNTKGDYLLEQRVNDLANMYSTYTHSQYGSAYKQSFPELGFAPSKMSNTIFSENAVDIESGLFGISSTNLVKETPQCVPSWKSPLPTKSYFDRIPMIMPTPLVIIKNQRHCPT